MACFQLRARLSKKILLRMVAVVTVTILIFNRSYLADVVLKLPVTELHWNNIALQTVPKSVVDGTLDSQGVLRTSLSNKKDIHNSTEVPKSRLQKESKTAPLKTGEVLKTQNKNKNNAKTKTSEPKKISASDKIGISSRTTLSRKPVKTLHPAKQSEETCAFPKMDPLNPTVKKFWVKIPTVNCTDGMPSLVYRDGEYLNFNYTRARRLNVSVDTCQYTPLFMRKGSDHFTELPQWSRPFKDRIKLPEIFENLWIQCKYKKKLVSQTFSTLVKMRNSTEAKCSARYKEHLRKNSPKETMSVLLIGIDGISRGNSMRSMPKTREFIINQLDAMELYKVNKIGDNTLPNVAALLTGNTMNELRENFTYAEEYFDKVDHKFIWKAYSDAGYRIGFIADRQSVSAFHYQKKGWNNHVFDYHHRPAVVTWDHNRAARRSSQFCVGQVPEVDHLFDFWFQLATVFNSSKTQPYFGYSFFCHLTHDEPNLATAGDELYLNFFKELKRRNVLHNTIIFFFSDHGARFGPFRFTYHGLLETRNPMAFFIFPKWFKNKYPKVMENFRINQNRLVTYFDVHETLHDILNFKGEIKKAKFTDKGISLFKEIPATRQCGYAGVSMNYCLCSQKANIEAPKSLWIPMSEKMMTVVLRMSAKYREKCYVLSMVSIKTVVALKDTYDRKGREFYRAIIETKPGGAVYEGLMEYRIEDKRIRSVAMPTRLNLYRGQAECVEEEEIRPFCVCRDRFTLPPT